MEEFFLPQHQSPGTYFNTRNAAGQTKKQLPFAVYLGILAVALGSSTQCSMGGITLVFEFID
jgi:hypothetical protein